MPASRPLSDMEILAAEEYDGDYFSFSEWVRRHIKSWAEHETSHGSYYARFVEYFTHDALSTCESCGRTGEWFVSDICVRCHAAICNSCAKLHFRLTAVICRTCYMSTCKEFLRDARRSERRKHVKTKENLTIST